MGLLAILIALVGLMLAAYRGWSVILVAPVFAFVAALGSEHAVMPVMSELYFTRMAEYFKSFFVIFLLGAIFAKLMEKGGMATAIASAIINAFGEKNAIIAVIVACAVLVYGGLSVFVVAFVMYPFGAFMFKQAKIPKRLLPATLWVGIFTFAMVSLPGAPQIQNIIPATFFGTNTWSGMGISLFATILYLLIGWGWITYRAKHLMAGGEGYGTDREKLEVPDSSDLPSVGMSLIPIVLVVALNAYFSNPFNQSWCWKWDNNMLQSLLPLKISLMVASVAKVQSIWSLSIALIIGSLVAAFVGRKEFKKLGGYRAEINAATISSCAAILNVCSGFAFGAVLTSLAGFLVIKNALLGVSGGGNPLWSVVLTTNVMCAITGSSSSGMTIALNMLATQWTQMAQATGVSLDALHRIVCIASIGIDPVPHAGALVTLLGICGLTHKESYGDIIALLGFKFFVPFLCVLFYMATGIA